MLVYSISRDGEEKYIGLTQCSLEKRWREHRCAARSGLLTPLYRAMRKYGIDAFEVKQIASAKSREDLAATEQALIADRRTHVSVGGYNVEFGGQLGDHENKIRGEKSQNARLTEEFVRYIRDPEVADIPNSELVNIAKAEFGIIVGSDAIKNARNGRAWKHVEIAPVVVTRGARRRLDHNALSEAAKAIFNRPDVREKSLAAFRRKVKDKPATEKCSLSPCQVWDIFYGHEPSQKAAKRHGVSKKTILNVRHKKILQYRLDVDGVL